MRAIDAAYKAARQAAVQEIRDREAAAEEAVAQTAAVQRGPTVPHEVAGGSSEIDSLEVNLAKTTINPSQAESDEEPEAEFSDGDEVSDSS